ncbi:fungal-specific transcription factor domain-containing protein [Rhizophagus clarus]|uniref:Fungal-specific transcription factor domain-containing protein n=1 Tax=Rhizophagus clarus TaxID=94130 RepID=A0A8H3L0X6_9GLOM|nr:fungal-specific transcription factor domain-containing protein [Rhizophagus clarus]
MNIPPKIQPPINLPNITSATHKRFKPIETCDNCKQPSSKRGRPKTEVEILAEQIEDIQSVQFQQLDHMESLLEMAVMRNGGTAVTSSNTNDNMGGSMNFAIQNGAVDENFMASGVYNWNNFYESSPPPSLNQNLSEETLQFSTQLAASLPKPKQPETVPVTDSMSYTANFGLPIQDPVDQLADKLDNSLKIYESTRYVGTGSLLMLSDGGEEQIIPQFPDDLSSVEPYLKVLPNPETVESLIDIYYKRVYRHFPHLKKKVVLDCIKDLSMPQHFLLLNSIFFAASPFHPDVNMRDGRIYHQRALALLQNHCLQTPHVLTVISLFIIGLHTRKMGSAWIFHGMASKMTFELGLHRKIKNQQIKMNEVKEMRDMAFWGCFIAETWVSACYGRPSAIDEATCDVDLLPIPSDPEPDDETRLHIAWVLHINLLRIFAQVRKYLYGRAKIAGSRREENQFRFLDAALGRWFYTLPHWLKFEEMAQNVQGSLLGAIGGEMHTLFWTVLILLHSRNLTMFTVNPTTSMTSDDASRASSRTICIHAATILLHWLDVLMNSVPEFYEQSCTALFSIAPAIRVLAWTAQRGDTKAESMVERLKEIKKNVKDIARRGFMAQEGRREGRLDGEEKLQEWLDKAKEEEAKNTQARAGEYMMLNPDQYRKEFSYIANKGKRPTNNRQRNKNDNKSALWTDDKDNFPFTFTMDTFNNGFRDRSQPSNDSSIMNQQYQQQPSNNPSMANILFSTLSPSNTSASTSPNPTASPNPPIFGSQNVIMNNNISRQQQTNTSNIWTPQDNGSVGMLNTFNGDIDAKLVNNNYNDGNNIISNGESVAWS